MKKIQTYTPQPDFQPEKIEKVRLVHAISGQGMLDAAAAAYRACVVRHQLDHYACNMALACKGWMSLHMFFLLPMSSSAVLSETCMLTVSVGASFIACVQVSKAAYGLCCWVRAMETYDRVAKVVGPKKEALKTAEAQLEVCTHSAGTGWRMPAARGKSLNRVYVTLCESDASAEEQQQAACAQACRRCCIHASIQGRHPTWRCLHWLLQVVMTALGVKQAELAAVLKKLADLDTDLAEKVARKENLEAEVELCKVKLDR
jgi:hypothetical protein